MIGASAKRAAQELARALVVDPTLTYAASYALIQIAMDGTDREMVPLLRSAKTDLESPGSHNPAIDQDVLKSVIEGLARTIEALKPAETVLDRLGKFLARHWLIG